ncbi:efflux RND transporter permease subunit [Peredibacter sp. HCB2-198]|uniref:efflux RND transporter permease subunit n=1 Tax=Peredibacter sp. HCB2-198 TaxID=3383025 RepID=UPI0038B53DFB
MMKTIIRFSVQNSVLVLFFTVVVSLYGLYCFKKLTIDAVPDTTNVQVQVITLGGGLSPEEIERQITFPIEQALNGIKGIEEVRSISRFGLSHITVIFSEETKILDARQLISERILNVEETFKGKFKVFMGPIVTGLGDIYHYALLPKDNHKKMTLEDAMEIRSLQEWVVRPRLLREKGVAEVNTLGLYQKQYYVIPDLQKMHLRGVAVREIIEALEENNYNVGGSYFEEKDSQILIQGVGLLRNLEDIGEVPIKMSKNLGAILIKDVAETRLDKSLIVGSSTLNGQMALIGSPLMLAGDNSREVAVRLDKTVKEINETMLKDHVIVPLYNRAELVNKTLGTVEHNLFLGCGLVILVLLLLIGDLRASLVTALMIPVSLLITFIIMTHTKLSGNLMSLGALDFGVIIDAVVVVIDNCLRHISAKKKEKGFRLSKAEIRETVIDATAEIMSAAGLGRIIIILVFVPLLLLTGVEGKMFAPMAKTFIYALVAVFVLSFTTVPALAAKVLKGDYEEKTPFIMRYFEKAYFPFLKWSMNRFWGLTIFSVGILGVSFYLFSTLGGEFIPRLDEGSAAIRVVRKADIAPSFVVSEQERLENEILKIPEVKHTFSRIGTAEVPDDPNGMNFSDMFVEFRPEKEWREGITRPLLKDEILKQLKKKPNGAVFMMGQPIEMRTNELLEGTRSDISLKIFGEDLNVVTETAQKLKSVIEKVRGSQDVELDVQGKNKLLKISPKVEMRRNMAYGNNDILDTVQFIMGGKEVGKIFEDIRSYPLVVRMDNKERANLERIKEIPVNVNDGLNIKLHQIADLEIKDAISVVTRENSRRRVALLINVKNRDIESYVKEAAAKVQKEVKLPPGTTLEWGGNFKNLQNAKSRLFIILPITLLVVFLLIYYAFFNWALSLLIFACIPFAWVGGILMLWGSGLPFSISAGVGFIALSGIAVVNGMVLITYFNNLRYHHKTGDELILTGVKLRIRPVLMTALTDIFGFLPMAFSGGLGSEVQRPLALVVIGGVITSTLLTLIFLPALYRYFEEKIGLGKPMKH